MTSYGREETFGWDSAVLKGQLAEPRAAGNGLRTHAISLREVPFRF